MEMKFSVPLLAALFFCGVAAFAHSATTDQRPWNSKWIAAPNDDGQDYSVQYFRKSIDLESKPETFPVHVSADNRYKLFVNGELVSLGPARGDLSYWNYETVDLAPWLTEGKNTVAALVFNEGRHRPEAQISRRTAFIVQGAGEAVEVLNTNKGWKCLRAEGHGPAPEYFFAAVKGESVDMNRAVAGDWAARDFDDSGWAEAAEVDDGRLKGTWDGGDWQLVPSPLPPRVLTREKRLQLRKATGVTAPEDFPERGTTIPPHTEAVFLLDQTYLTNAYVTLNFSGGKDAEISLSYAESLYEEKTDHGWRKENRDEVEGKIFLGVKDTLISSGRENQSFTSLNFRTYRYLQLTVRTKDDPLVIDELYGMFTAYPFERVAKLEADDAAIQEILDVGWRTALLNAWETYMDCPYYEQLQYIGDTRVQAMISYYNTTDDRLARHAIDLIDHSRRPDGLTLSRYPTRGVQIITPFSLWYVGMLHDYWMYRGDEDFVAEKLPGARGVLDFFAKYQQPDGSLKDVPYWTFADWSGGDGWWIGAPPRGGDGSSAILDLQLLWALQWQAEMEAAMGLPFYADLYAEKAKQLKETIQRKYWDPERKLYADTIDRTKFSQHANALAILTGVAPEAEREGIARRMLEDGSLSQCSIYFKYYLHQALVKAGLGDDYVKWLEIWRKNLEMGLTTWAEDSNIDYARSDCHAWGSSPNIEFFRTVLGVDTDAPGFREIRVEPHLGSLTRASGEIPHPAGIVKVAYALEDGVWHVNVTLPEETSGRLVWKGREHPLKAGVNSFEL